MWVKANPFTFQYEKINTKSFIADNCACLRFTFQYEKINTRTYFLFLLVLIIHLHSNMKRLIPIHNPQRRDASSNLHSNMKRLIPQQSGLLSIADISFTFQYEKINTKINFLVVQRTIRIYIPI